MCTHNRRRISGRHRVRAGLRFSAICRDFRNGACAGWCTGWCTGSDGTRNGTLSEAAPETTLPIILILFQQDVVLCPGRIPDSVQKLGVHQQGIIRCVLQNTRCNFVCVHINPCQLFVHADFCRQAQPDRGRVLCYPRFFIPLQQPEGRVKGRNAGCCPIPELIRTYSRLR
jgi:hypothetical protein